MKKRHLHHQGLMILTAALFALTAGGFSASRPAAAGELDKLDTSLKLIPADAAFYSSMLRNREQVEAFLRSNAWAKIQSMPSVQMGLALYDAQAQQPGTPVSKFQTAQQNPEVKKLINLAADMGSNEIFVYGNENFSDFVELMQCMASSMRYGPAKLEAAGKAEGSKKDKMQAKLVLQTLIDHVDLVEFPDLLIGFRLKKPAAANEALIKLETILNISLEAIPNLKGHLNKETIDDREYLVLRLDGNMIPWKEVPMDELKEIADDEAGLQKLVEHVKNMEFVLVMGVRDNDLLISLGSSIDCIKNLGSSQRLIDLPEFKPLEKFADKRLTGIGYVNKELNEQINNNGKNIDDLQDFLAEMIPLAKFPEAQSDQLTKDVESLADDLKDMLPEVGPIMALTFLTDNGYEGYQYAWGKYPDRDGSKPLGLLKHMGGNPILGIVHRGKVSAEHDDKMAKWMNIGWKYIEELALPRIPEKDRSKVTALVNDLKPLLKRLGAATHDMLLPALADGQIGLVIDAKLTSKQLQTSLPAYEKELPVLEPALVLGVSNAELLRKAISEFRGVYNDLIDLIGKQKDLPPEVAANINNYKWPEAKVDKIAGGSIFSYPLPQKWGVDKNIVPNAGLSDKVAVLTLSPKQTDRLLNETPLKVGGVLSNIDRPLAGAGWIDFNELIRAATPWINYALEQMSEEQLGGQKQAAIAQTQTVLEVLSTIKCFTGEAYIEDDTLVSHSLLEIHDLGK